MLYAKVHRPHQISNVKVMLPRHKTTLINIPDGVTSSVQPLDVPIIKSFKNHERAAFEQQSFSLCTNEKLTAFNLLVLFIWSNIKLNK